ncbi:NAD(P)-binding protein [Pantoea sp.]|uniref:NAD(P)-binding protein n=1 Tax=Pantoea sp. TaxID=69393 RepID=UPI00257FB905|nr:NAD(P)-binding protein [Pantoea sp.]MBS6435522.1 NAD(P)-binding protein [Pantoea sp.]
MLPFSSFWQAGYEGADHINTAGQRLVMDALTGHQTRFRNDYLALQHFGIRTVRESIGWRQAEEDPERTFATLQGKMQAAQELGIQINWTLCHYGWPEDVDLFSDNFVPRFAAFCQRVAAFLAPWYHRAPIYSPMNEISFLSWGLSVGLFGNHREADPDDIKRQLARATLAGCDAIWLADPRARFLHCDPLIHLVPDEESEACYQLTAELNAAQFQAWDMLAGAREPELGGAPRYLDIIGANYYHANQWEANSNQRLAWHLGDGRRKPLHKLLLNLAQRYQRPILLAETSHVGSGRPAWMSYITAQIAQAQLDGCEILGVCIYPIIESPLWEDPHHWPRSGLWDVAPDFTRQLHQPTAAALRQSQRSLHRFHALLSPAGEPQESSMKQSVLVVFSHLRWGFVFQRPQHLLSRLAQHHRVLFIEEPVYQPGEAGLRQQSPAPNVTVIEPHTDVAAPGFHDSQIAVLQTLLATLLENDEQPLVWFYTPMALPLLACFNPSAIIYDCMDELSAFQMAPRQLQQRESALLSRADVVFTGGTSLYEAKKHRHQNVHCFASSVDAAHFEQALDRSNGHPLQENLAGPILGYYGVIDERMDIGLIAALADAHPDWHIAMVGPVVKIDPLSLPQRPNLHWFGQQPYEALPHFLAGWDVCLMPFALNASTRFISPTKVLEYMAAQLPVVSTAVPDVVRHYSDVVSIADTPQGFILACEAALGLSDEARRQQAAQMAAIIAETSWDRTAEQMQAQIVRLRDNVVQPVAAAKVPETTDGVRAVTLRPVECLILGAGPTGLSAGYHYGEGAVVLEKNETPGGWCRSIADKGFTFDYAGHIMFSNDPYVLQLYDKLLGDNLHWQNREAWVYSHDVFTRYPFQSALHGLQAEVIGECVLGAIEARYGVTGAQEAAPLSAVRSAANTDCRDCCADGVLGAEATEPAGADAAEEDFENFIFRTWGRGIAHHFAVPYNRKLWKTPLADMETSWLGGRVPLPDLQQIISGALAPLDKPVGPNARFGYPKRGGFQALMNGFLPHLTCALETDSEIADIQPQNRSVILKDGRHYHYDQMISTLPLPELVRLMGNRAPQAVQQAASLLRHVSVRCVNLGIGRANLSDKHWIYYPGDTLFHRIFLQGNASPECNPLGGFGLTCEITYRADQPLPYEGDALIQRCIDDCIRVGIIREDDVIVTANEVDMPYAYVVYDHQRKANVALIRNWLAAQGIHLSGRYSEWEYYNSDHAFLAGKRAAETVKALLTNRKTTA